MKRNEERVGKRHEGMKTALGGGSQHREEDVNDSRGKVINNAGHPSPSVPMSLFRLPIPSIPFTLYLYFFIIRLQSSFCLSVVTDLTSRGSSPHQACDAAAFYTCPSLHKF